MRNDPDKWRRGRDARRGGGGDFRKRTTVTENRRQRGFKVKLTSVTFSGPPRRKQHFLPMIRRRRERCTTTRFRRQPPRGFNRPPGGRSSWGVASLRSNTGRWIQRKGTRRLKQYHVWGFHGVKHRFPPPAQQGVKRRHSVSCVRPSSPRGAFSSSPSTLPVSLTSLFLCHHSHFEQGITPQQPERRPNCPVPFEHPN